MPCARHPIIGAAGSCPLCAPVELTPRQRVEVKLAELERLETHRERVRAERQRREIEKARTDLATFFRASWHVLEPDTPLEWNWHLDVVCRHVQAVFEDWARKGEDPSYVARAQNLVINVPPGTAKSRILSVCAPAWAWLRWPGMRILCLSANPDVALRDSTYCRDLIESDWYRESFAPDFELSSDQNAKTKYRNTRGGERTAKGITAKITGNRADVILVDDPHDAKEIHSEGKRTAVTTNWDTAIHNRVNDLRRSIRIGIMQRLHELDWTGHVLGKGDHWHRLVLPMEFEPDPDENTPEAVESVCHTAKRPTFLGWVDPRIDAREVLHPERFTPEVLSVERTTLGSYGYASQMQQRPTPAGGGIFKRAWWKWWRKEGVSTGNRSRPLGCSVEPATPLPPLEWILVSIDAAFKGTAESDRVSMLVIGGRQADRFVLADHTRVRTFTETIDDIRRLRAEWPRVAKWLIEDKANGSAIIDTLGSEIPGVIAVNPEGGKESRAWATSPQIESGNWYLEDGAAWPGEFVDECDVFPNGAHDDRVDALTQCAIHMTLSPDVARAALLLAGGHHRNSARA